MKKPLSNLLICLIVPLLSFSNPGGDGVKSSYVHLIPLEVEGVYEYRTSSAYLVQLTKKGGQADWVLPMIIGGCEAKAIARSLSEREFPRPLTYDLIKSILTQTSVKLDHIIITKLEGGTFYAVLVLDDNGKAVEIDARPSDSMNIAMKTGVPIYGTNEVISVAKEKRPPKTSE